MLAPVSEHERDRVWADIETELAQFETPDGFTGSCELHIAAGTK
jgi:hypothetical protein